MNTEYRVRSLIALVPCTRVFGPGVILILAWCRFGLACDNIYLQGHFEECQRHGHWAGSVQPVSYCGNSRVECCGAMVFRLPRHSWRLTFKRPFVFWWVVFAVRFCIPTLNLSAVLCRPGYGAFSDDSLISISYSRSRYHM
jgi:hypothetical protein